MKPISILIATLAIPSSLAFAQQVTTTGDSSSIPYIPLIGTPGSTGATGGATNAMAWFIDVANRQVVACAQPVTTTSPTAQSFTCTAQPIPAAPSATSGTTPGTGATPSATSSISPLGNGAVTSAAPGFTSGAAR